MLITGYHHFLSVITALAGRRHSDWRKSQSDCWGQGLHRGGTALRRLRHREGDVSSVTTTWGLSPVCTAWPAELAWLVTRLPWARHTAQPPTPTPQPNLEFQVLSSEEMVLCLDYVFFPICYDLFCPPFSADVSYKLLNPHLLHHQTPTWTLRTGSGISFTWQQAACRDSDHSQPIIFMSLEYLSS